jgi:hypothetical protein
MSNTLIKNGERVTKYVPPNIQVMMSGCCWIDVASGGRCCATYADGTKEYATSGTPPTELERSITP